MTSFRIDEYNYESITEGWDNTLYPESEAKRLVFVRPSRQPGSERSVTPDLEAWLCFFKKQPFWPDAQF